MLGSKILRCLFSLKYINILLLQCSSTMKGKDIPSEEKQSCSIDKSEKVERSVWHQISIYKNSLLLSETLSHGFWNGKHKTKNSLSAPNIGSMVTFLGFPCSSAGKESTCNAEDPRLIPELGRSPGEWIGYPFQYSWASLLAQMINNPPAVQETWVWSLDWKDTQEESMATHSSIQARLVLI